jgi:Raf kinase inhibitor-like YbhB/YbcL family protein
LRSSSTIPRAGSEGAEDDVGALGGLQPARTIHALAEGAARNLPAGARDGKNDWKRIGYGGPCPPVGRHRYFHKLYALDTALPDLHEPTKVQLESAMNGHVLAQAELIGTYEKGA